MRKILSSVLMLVTGMVLLNSCEKVNVPQDVNTLGKGSYVTLEKTTNLILDYSNLTGSKASIDVAQYGVDQEKLTIYVASGTPTQDKTKWKKIKEVPNDNNGKYSLSVSGQEIATAIAPALIAPGNQYTMYNVITTKDGRTFDYANTSTSFSGNPNYRMALAWSATVVCPFTNGSMAGKYIVDRDDWIDWSPGDEVDVTDGPGTNQVNISKVWPGAPVGGIIVNPLVIDVKPATGEASVKTGLVWGNYGGSSNYSAGSPSTGFVFSCTHQIIMNIRIISSGAGDQGSFNLWLHKK